MNILNSQGGYMKRFLFVLSVVSMLMGCATMVPIGGLYTGVKLPMIATSNSSASSKTGEAECISVLSLIAIGDCSIDAAKKNGGITKVNNVDWNAMNVLGIYGSYKVIVSGE
jgi:hypothetical protein